jgi:metallo-beta-lactamase family protein
MKMNELFKVQFLGAAGTVTGSKYYIETAGKKFLVDCGLFQGLKELRLRNWNSLPIDCSALDFVLLTHGHLDHVGYLPLLIKQGFKGKIYATLPTVEIAKLILLDSARIQEEDAERANAQHYSKHQPAKPLYTVKEAEQVFSHFQSEPEDEWIEMTDDLAFRFRYNGHIIGSVFIELRIGNRRVVFSGDVGRIEDPLLYPPMQPEHADILFIESTYGAKIHQEHPKEQLGKAIYEALQRNGTIIIPSFAVERTQLLMYYLWELHKEHAIPDIPIYMDSPMGSRMLDIFRKHGSWHKLVPPIYAEMCKRIHIVNKQEETYKLAANKEPKIIIAASGMASGGRVLIYFDKLIGNPDTTILLVGHQGEGTRGRALLDGAEEIKLHGKFIHVRANVVNIEGLSAHADQSELVHWLANLENKPEHVFIVHGEPEGSIALKGKLKQVYDINSEIPRQDEVFQL